MRATLAHATPVADTATVDELLNAIGAHFRWQRNIALSCVQFEERKQQHGEAFDRFLVGLKELAADADLCATCLDARLITRIMSGVRSEALRKKLLAINPFPALKDVLALCRAEESAEHTDADLTSKPSVNAASRSHRRSPAQANAPRSSRVTCMCRRSTANVSIAADARTRLARTALRMARRAPRVGRSITLLLCVVHKKATGRFQDSRQASGTTSSLSKASALRSGSALE